MLSAAIGILHEQLLKKAQTRFFKYKHCNEYCFKKAYRNPIMSNCFDMI